jgi:hypothetical protein
MILVRLVLVSVAFTCVFSSGIARADINGFGDFSQFTLNQGDSASAPTISTGVIHLTNQGTEERRSIFYNIPQSIASFTASFTYQSANGIEDTDGAAFVIQNSPSQATALGYYTGALGYSGLNGSGTAGGIVNSAAISLELGPVGTLSGFYTQGNKLGGSSPLSPLNLLSGNPINVTITYDGSKLTETLLDTVTSANYSATFLTNLPSVVGSPTAYVGFTATTDNGVTQTLSNFQFSAVPEPGSLGLLAIGAVGLAVRRRV